MDLNFKAINKGTHIIANDTLIVGNADSDPTDGHDQCLIQVLNKCCEVGLKPNPDKCIFKMMQVLFYGLLVASIGLKPDSSKIIAIANIPAS